MARGQGAIQIVDEIKNSLNANDMISSIDERFNSIIGKYNYVKKYYGKVISVKNNQTKATVSISGQDTNMTFLNKTGEMLKVGDYVKIECAGEDMTSAFISERFGASNIENLNRLNSSLDTSSLVSALNSIFTFLNSQQKSLLATAITLKGVPTSASDSFAQMAYNILQIQSGSFYIEAVSAATVSFSWFVGVNVRYRIDTGNWIDYTSGTNISLSANQKLYFRGLNVVTNKEKHFVINGTVNVHGDITHLIHGKGGDQALVSAKCCSYMFYNCTGVRTAPNLPSTILSESCYSYMFYGCTSLIAAPALPATVLTESCYMNMFYNCSNLITVPELNAPVMTYACYAGMFYGCSKITQTPTLPSKSLALACYDNMFLRCTSLTTVTTLPADVLAESCYSYMFGSCTSLGRPPVLKATKLANNCYMSMFKGCSRLAVKVGNVNNYLWRIPATTITGNDPVLMMNHNTSPTSVTVTIPATAYNYYLVDDAITPLYFIGVGSSNWIKLDWVSGTNVKYSINDGEWIDYTQNSIINFGKDKVAFIGLNVITNENHHFSMGGQITGGGNVTSLTDSVGSYAELTTSYCYSYMFADCTALLETPNLPSMSLSSYCYYKMFKGCTGLTMPAQLPATTLSAYCYSYMFDGCTGIKLYSRKTTQCKEYRVPCAGTGTAQNTSMLYMFNNTGGYVNEPLINTTYYISAVPPAPIYGDGCITFYSYSTFTIAMGGTKGWTGIVQYSVDKENWINWNGQSVTSAQISSGLYVVCLRGIGNSRIRYEDGRYTSTWHSYITATGGGGNIFCKGNVENLLDYEMVAVGEHPAMGVGALCDVFSSHNSSVTIKYVLQFPSLNLTDYCYGWARLVPYSSTRDSTYKYPYRIPPEGTASGSSYYRTGASNVPDINTTVYIQYDPDTIG